MSAPLKGSCLCGAVKFTAAPREENFGTCHCDMCRKWSGGNFMAIDCGDSFALTEGADSLKYYNSSMWGKRGFCGNCGTSLVWAMQKGNHTMVSRMALEGAEKFAFVSEIFIDEKPDSYSFSNETKKMTGPEVMALYSGGGDNSG